MVDREYLIYFYENMEATSSLEQNEQYTFCFYNELRKMMIMAIRCDNYEHFQLSICSMENVLIRDIEKINGLSATTEMWNSILQERVRRGHRTILLGRLRPENLFNGIPQNEICYLKKD